MRSLCIVEGRGVVAMVSDTRRVGSCVYYAGKRDSHTSHECVLTLLWWCKAPRPPPTLAPCWRLGQDLGLHGTWRPWGLGVLSNNQESASQQHASRHGQERDVRGYPYLTRPLLIHRFNRTSVSGMYVLHSQYSPCYTVQTGPVSTAAESLERPAALVEGERCQ